VQSLDFPTGKRPKKSSGDGFLPGSVLRAAFEIRAISYL
jgi:hypothetical protein